MMTSSTLFTLLAVVILALIFPRSSDGAKILVVPGNINSHIMYFGRLADQLAELGHTVHILVPSNAKVSADLVAATERTASSAVNSTADDGRNTQRITPSGRLTLERYAVDGDIPFTSSPEMTETMIRAAISPSTFEKFRVMIPFLGRMLTYFTADCSRLLDNTELVERVRAAHYDVSIHDPAFANCYMLTYATRIRHLMSLSVPVSTLTYRVPRLPSFVNEVDKSDRMTFFERLASFIQSAILSRAMLLTDTEFSRKYAADREPIGVSDLMFSTSIWLYLEDPVLSFPHPLMPNTIQVGDLMAGRPGRPLPNELEQFVADHSQGGVVIVSFGSFLDHVPDSVLRMFCESLQGLDPSLGIIWKQSKTSVCDGLVQQDFSARLRIIPWIPQNDLLSDPRVRAFITHGGLNSLVEAAYHGKPVVVVPISLDQPANAAAAVARGMAVRVELSDPDFVSSLQAAVSAVLRDPRYSKAAQFASSLIADRRDTAAERASAAIEHVIKYGDEHLRSGAFELNIVQYLMFDLFLALTAIAAMMACCLALTARTAWRRCCSKRNKTKRD